MKILSNQQIRKADQYTIKNESIASIDLMERAATTFVDEILPFIDKNNKIHILCGMGNNGGDGLVAARLLFQMDFNIQVYVVQYASQGSTDFNINLQRFESICKENIVLITEGDENKIKDISAEDFIIDAMWGSGLSRPVTGFAANVIDMINQSGAFVIGLDFPSGLFAGKMAEGTIVHADLTVTFQLPKLSMFMPENYWYVGDWIVVDIGLNEDFIQKQNTNYHYITFEDVEQWMPQRGKFDHKGNFGHAMIIAGSKGKMGAAVLSARACLRSGAGLVDVHVPQCGYSILQTAVPEAMVSVDTDVNQFTSTPDLKNIDTIAIGPGLGTESKTAKALKTLLIKASSPVVLDADALNLIAQNKDWLKLIPENSILTPHPGEFRRLAGDWKNDYHKLELLRKLATDNQLIVVLKGGHTIIALPEGNVWFNTTGNPGMATAGSGDVLTGIITGLLAQKLSPEKASLLGVFLHGLSGDEAMLKMGEHALTAADIIDCLEDAFLVLAE
jgi:ADP-dependent NAD(P)H-hydrate dehydratase / NAD(P)H-hydrate epimerase